MTLIELQGENENENEYERISKFYGENTFIEKFESLYIDKSEPIGWE